MAKTAKTKKMPRRVIRNAFSEAWENEAQRVADGRGTRQWTEQEQLELLSTGKVSGYSVHHMKNIYHHPEWADKVQNFQFLQNYFYENNPDNEHDLAHRAIPDGSTNGYYDHETGITHSFGDQPPNIKKFVKPLKHYYLKGHAWETQTDIKVLRSRYVTLRRDITEKEKDLIARKGINYVLGLRPHSPIVIEKVRDLKSKNTKRSWRAELQLIAMQRQCSRPWKEEELEKLFRFQRIDGFEPRAIEGNFSTLENITIDNVVFVPYKSPVQEYKKEVFDLPNNYFENIAEKKGVSVDEIILELTGVKTPRMQTPKKSKPHTTKQAYKAAQYTVDSRVRKTAREIEVNLIKKGQGTKQWTLEEQERWLCVGKGKGRTKDFLSYLIYPELGNKVENIAFTDSVMSPLPTPADKKLPKRQIYNLQQRFIDTDTYKTHFVNDKTIEKYLFAKEREAKRIADRKKREEMNQRPSIKTYTDKNDKKRHGDKAQRPSTTKMK